MPNDIIEMKQTEYAEMADRAKDGDRYRNFLKGELKRLGKLLGEGDIVKFAVDNIQGVPKLERALVEMKKKWDAKMPRQSMAVMSTDGAQLPISVDPKAQKIYDGLGVTAEDVEKYKNK